MPNTAASCCSSSSGSGARVPRATVCSETVVSAPAITPSATQPVVFSFWPIQIPLSTQYTRLDGTGRLKFTISLGPALSGDCRRGLGQGLSVPQIPVAQWLERGVEFIHQRYSVGYVQADDVLLGDAVKVFHQRAD